MKEFGTIVGVALVTTILALWVANIHVAKVPDGQMCTMEAKICPDGSAVGRTGPNCEFAACPEETAATSTVEDEDERILLYTSGVRGTVSLGPTCPVMREPPDPKCADKPYATAVLVYRTSSKTPFIIGNSDAEGAFAFSLPPGSYTITAGGNTILPRCERVEVNVGPSGYTTTTISCDTGIR